MSFAKHPPLTPNPSTRLQVGHALHLGVLLQVEVLLGEENALCFLFCFVFEEEEEEEVEEGESRKKKKSRRRRASIPFSRSSTSVRVMAFIFPLLRGAMDMGSRAEDAAGVSGAGQSREQGGIRTCLSERAAAADRRAAIDFALADIIDFLLNSPLNRCL